MRGVSYNKTPSPRFSRPLLLPRQPQTAPQPTAPPPPTVTSTAPKHPPPTEPPPPATSISIRRTQTHPPPLQPARGVRRPRPPCRCQVPLCLVGHTPRIAQPGPARKTIPFVSPKTTALTRTNSAGRSEGVGASGFSGQPSQPPPARRLRARRCPLTAASPGELPGRRLDGSTRTDALYIPPKRQRSVRSYLRNTTLLSAPGQTPRRRMEPEVHAARSPHPGENGAPHIVG